MGHGFVQGPMHKVENQADAIKRSVETISKFAGKPPRSWESPGLTETEETLDLLRLNGIEYVADWVIDDLPQEIATPHGTITTIPYSVETNDIVIHALQHLPSDQFLKRCTDQFDRLYLEGASNARIMAISIHPYITGVPHRIKYLEALLDYVRRSRRRRTHDSQRDWRLVSRRDGKELKFADLPQQRRRASAIRLRNRSRPR